MYKSNEGVPNTVNINVNLTENRIIYDTDGL